MLLPSRNEFQNTFDSYKKKERSISETLSKDVAS